MTDTTFNESEFDLNITHGWCMNFTQGTKWKSFSFQGHLGLNRPFVLLKKAFNLAFCAVIIDTVRHFRFFPSNWMCLRSMFAQNDCIELVHISCVAKHIINFILVLNTIEDILKNVGNQTVAGPQWLPFFFYYQSQWGPATVWLPTFFKISSFVLRIRIIQVLFY